MVGWYLLQIGCIHNDNIGYLFLEKLRGMCSNMSLLTILIAVVLRAVLVLVTRSEAGLAVISLRELLKAVSRNMSILLTSVIIIIWTVSKKMV